MTIAAPLPVVEVLGVIDSTNAEAKRRAQAGMRGPIWLRADTQTAGVGRSRREWHSPSGNLYATLLISFSAPLSQAALMSFVACLAVADTIEKVVSTGGVSLKWPNDALLNEKKVAGVLLEAGGSETDRWLAIGIGMNVASKPEDVRWPAISLAELGSTPTVDEVFMTLVQAFNRWKTLFQESGFGPIREAWLSRAARLGEPIEARLPEITHRGVFKGLDDDGALILASESAEMRIAAADVHFATEENTNASRD